MGVCCFCQGTRVSEALDLDTVEGQVVSVHCQRAGGHGAPPDLSLSAPEAPGPSRRKGGREEALSESALKSGSLCLFHFLLCKKKGFS